MRGAVQAITNALEHVTDEDAAFIIDIACTTIETSPAQPPLSSQLSDLLSEIANHWTDYVGADDHPDGDGATVDAQTVAW